MPHLSFLTLGPVQVQLGTAPITRFRSVKAQALLVYLAVAEKHAYTRDALLGMFWPDQPQDAAQVNLRQTLSRLQSAIGNKKATPPFLLIDRETVRFNRASDYELDIEHFRRHFYQCAHHGEQGTIECAECVSARKEAVALYRGDFLAHFHSDSPAFDQWAETIRLQTRRQVIDALQFLSDYHEQRGEYALAVEYLEQQVGIEPWREEAYRHQMRLLARMGERSRALALYEQCHHALDEELGVEPAEATLELYQRIRGMTTERPHNLPAQANRFVGRSEELAQISMCLANARRRLVTLVGPGGIGKTRLALETAQRAALEYEGPFPQGVFFVSLAGIQAGGYMLGSIADALGFAFSGPEDQEEQLLTYLSERELLIVMDNFEHLLEQGERFLTRLLQDAPSIHMLVTSRERLNLAEEWVVEIRGLATPPKADDSMGQRDSPKQDSQSVAAELSAYSAVQLFVERAQKVAAHFRLEEDIGEARAVARICRLVEGAPLAIELAAAWTHMLPCHEIADEIERNLDFLASAHRDVPSRHHSLRAVFDHSWQQLNPDERAVYPHMTVFRGSFDRHAAHAVAGVSLSVLAGFVAKSLVDVATVGRYRLHELLRYFAAEKLSEASLRKLRADHATYFVEWLHRQKADLNGTRQNMILAQTQSDIENIRASWLWAVANEESKTLIHALPTLYHFYFVRCWHDEGLEMLGYAEEMLVERLRVRDDPAGRRRLDNGIDPVVSARDKEALARVLAYLGNAHYSQNHLVLAQEYYQRALAHCRGRLADVEAYCYQQLGYAAYDQGDYLRAKEWIERSLSGNGPTDAWEQDARVLMALGAIELALGNYAEGRTHLLASEAEYSKRDDLWGLAHSRRWLGIAAYRRGAYFEARAKLEESLSLCEQIEDGIGTAMVFYDLGVLDEAEGGYGNSAKLYQASLTLLHNDDLQLLKARALKGLGGLHTRHGRYRKAYELLRDALQRAATIHANQLLPDILLEVAKLLWAALPAQQDDARQIAEYVSRSPTAIWHIQSEAQTLLELWSHDSQVELVQKDEVAIRNGKDWNTGYRDVMNGGGSLTECNSHTEELAQVVAKVVDMLDAISVSHRIEFGV